MLRASDPRYAARRRDEALWRSRIGFGEARASLPEEAEGFFTSFRMTTKSITDFSTTFSGFPVRLETLVPPEKHQPGP